MLGNRPHPATSLGGRLISRGRLIAVVVLVYLAAMAVSAAACEGVGGPELTTLSTKLSGEGKEGETLTVLEGSKVKDKATLKGKNAASATGKVTYKVYSDSECKKLVTTAGEVTVSGESVPASSEEELTGGASYYWQAHYGGDSKNAESTSECTEISSVKAKTSLSTKLSGESKEGEELTILEGSKAEDKATLGGTNSATAGGKVVYKIYSDKECKTLLEEAGEVTVSSGSVPPSSEEGLEGGKVYYWQATYKGDGLHQESTSECGKEVLKVKAKTTLATTLSGEGKEGAEITVLEGTKAKDKATVEGPSSSTAEGKVIYKVYSDSKCEHLVAEAGEKSVSLGSAAASNEEEREGAKTYYWQAIYTGDGLHQESTSACGKEVLTVKAKTSLSTTLSGEGKEGTEITVLEGAKAKDDATLEGVNAATAGGTVTYKIYSDKECKTLVVEAGKATVAFGVVPVSGEEELEGGKTYYWQATYKGDGLHQESTSSCSSEILTVKSRIALSTELSGEGESSPRIEVQEAAKAHDTATLEGTNVATASGTVQYDIYSDSACTELVAKAGEGTLESGGKAPASAEESLVTGRYYWQATYSGDSTHTAASSPCNSEIEVVAENTSLTTTLMGQTGESETGEGAELTVFEGGAAEDSVTLSGVDASMATGTITYNVYSDSECKELVASPGEAIVIGGAAAPSVSTFLPPGTYYWQASYSGDSLNKPSKSTCGSEVEKVTSAPITTSLAAEGQSGAQITVQEAAGVRDTATLHEENSSTATGEVTYKVYSDDECKKLVAEAGKVTLESGGKIPASGEEKLATGTYYWQATYSGDLSHAGGTSPCGAEVDTVAESTTLTTSLAGEGKEGGEIEVHEGSPVTDSATLSGTDSSLASGTVVYNIYSDSECKELFAEAEAGAGSVTGGVPASSSEVTLPAGTYYWQATYFGDTLNQSSTSTCGSEVEKVTTAALTSSLSGGGETGTELELDEETAVTDTATLHEENASTATGKVIYTVYADNECTTPLAEAGDVTVSEGKIPASSPETLGEGTYYWRAHYTGDGSHKEATSLCNQAVQNVDVPWILSVGDSYISGEGARRAGNNEELTAREARLITGLANTAYWGLDNSWIGNNEINGETNPGCHRSKSAEIMIGQDGAAQRVLGRNIACSGAETTSVSKGAYVVGGYVIKTGVFTPGLDFANAKTGELIDPARRERGECGLTLCLGQASQLQEFANRNRRPIKMVAISIGGDNFGFGEIVRACAKAFISPRWNKPCSETQAAKFERASITAREGEIEAGINNIGKALENAGYRKNEFTLLVQDYPSPIPEPGEFRFTETERTTNRWVNVTKRTAAGCEITNADATWINQTAVPKMNEAVRNVAKNVETAGRYKVVFLELESALKGHRLCEAGLKFVGEGTPPKPASWQAPGAAAESEWVTPIRVSPISPFESRESLHPNYWGQLALRNCLRQVYNNGTPLNGKKCVLQVPQGMRTARNLQIWGAGHDAWRDEPLMKLE